jgi:hypothetical protein
MKIYAIIYRDERGLLQIDECETLEEFNRKKATHKDDILEGFERTAKDVEIDLTIV